MSTDPRPGDGDGADMGTERDAWLREALRHAPDAAAGAPASVSDAILRQARQATASAAPPARRSAPTPAAASRNRSAAARRTAPWASLWSWLLQPTVATGFAGVMVATLVGVMWWGRPIDEPLREASRPDVSAPAERAAAPVASGEAAAVASPPAPSVGPAAPTVAPRVAADSRPAAKERAAASRQAPAENATDTAAARKTAPPGAAESQSVEKARRAAPGAADERARDTALAKSGPPAAAAAPATGTANTAPASPPPGPAPAAPAPAAAAVAAAPAGERKREQDAVADVARATATAGAQVTEAEAPAARPPEPFPAQATAAAPVAADVTRRLEARGAAGAAADRLPGALATLPPAARSTLEAAVNLPPGENPVARVRSAVAAWPEVWTWQRGGGSEQPMNDAVQAWLGQLDDATRSRWQVSAALAAPGMAAPLRLLRNGRLHTTVRIEAGAVRLEAAGETTAGAAAAAGATVAAGVPRAPVPGAVAAGLKAALEQAAP